MSDAPGATGTSASRIAAFRLWRRTRPFWAGFWTVFGGGIIAAVPATGLKFLLLPAGALLSVGILMGVAVAVFGVFLWIQPQLRYLLGVLILACSLVSLLTSDFGGLFVGMLLAILGGSMAMAWMPALPDTGKHRVRRILRLPARGGQAGT